MTIEGRDANVPASSHLFVVIVFTPALSSSSASEQKYKHDTCNQRTQYTPGGTKNARNEREPQQDSPEQLHLEDELPFIVAARSFRKRVDMQPE
ncbi:hypothetical protein GNF85_18415 [Clostridium perfringens]